jgi:chromosome segregation ATPase
MVAADEVYTKLVTMLRDTVWTTQRFLLPAAIFFLLAAIIGGLYSLKYGFDLEELVHKTAEKSADVEAASNQAIRTSLSIQEKNLELIANFNQLNDQVESFDVQTKSMESVLEELRGRGEGVVADSTSVLGQVTEAKNAVSLLLTQVSSSRIEADSILGQASATRALVARDRSEIADLKEDADGELEKLRTANGQLQHSIFVIAAFLYCDTVNGAIRSSTSTDNANRMLDYLGKIYSANEQDQKKFKSDVLSTCQTAPAN